MIFLKKYKNYHVLINWLNFSALYFKKIANDCLKKNQKKSIMYTCQKSI